MLSKRLCVGLGLVVAATRLDAQAWDDSRVRDLVQRATDRRVQQLADSGLVGYQATAHGYVTVLAQLGEGFRELPRVVKADELALEVYWRAPNLSKQRIIGRRDTTLLPTDIEYHRDHLGIIQNNFPAIIRLGDGDEVRDVPHPLSPAGLQQYEFALTDSLRISTPGRVIDVYEVKVRPKDDTLPRLIGSIYLDRETAHVVRMAFGFTRPAYRDQLLEDVFVILENGVVGGRFWLPRRQEIEIRRTLKWLDYPVRTAIRGRWEIRDYELTENPATTFFGPEIITAPPAVLKQYAWPPGRLTDSLPEESRMPTPAEIKRTMDEVRVLARARASQKGSFTLGGRGASDFLRFDRTSGLSLGTGLNLRLGKGVVIEGRGRYGAADRRGRGSLAVGWQSARGFGIKVFGSDDLRDAGDIAERSTLMNSLTAQEFGSDFTDYYRSRELGIAAHAPWRTATWTLSLWGVDQSSLTTRARPFSGSFRPAFDAATETSLWAGLRLEVPTTNLLGLDWRLWGEARTSIEPNYEATCPGTPCVSPNDIARFTASLELERPFAETRVATRTFAGLVHAQNHLQSQDLFFLGGPISAPGYAYHSLMGDRVLTQSIEAKIPVPFFRVSLGRFGRSSSRAALVPHWSISGVHQVDSTIKIQRSVGFGPPDPFRSNATGWYQSAGVSLITAFDLLRLDVSRALPRGRWVFTVDVIRPFWGIL